MHFKHIFKEGKLVKNHSLQKKETDRLKCEPHGLLQNVYSLLISIVIGVLVFKIQYQPATKKPNVVKSGCLVSIGLVSIAYRLTYIQQVATELV